MQQPQKKDESSSPLYATLFQIKPRESAFYFNNETTMANLIPLLKQFSVPQGPGRSAHLHDELARNTNLHQQLNVKQENTSSCLPRCSLPQK